MEYEEPLKEDMMFVEWQEREYREYEAPFSLGGRADPDWYWDVQQGLSLRMIEAKAYSDHVTAALCRCAFLDNLAVTGVSMED